MDRSNCRFCEKITQEGIVLEEPRRTHVVGCQIYASAIAGELGWLDMTISRNLLGHGLNFLFRKSFGCAGVLRSAVGPCGKPLRPDFDLYGRAFVLAIAAWLGYWPEIACAIGHDQINNMVSHWKHPLGGL